MAAASGDYVLRFRVDGPGVQQLEGIVQNFRRVNTNARMASGSADQVTRALNRVGGAGRVAAAVQISMWNNLQDMLMRVVTVMHSMGTKLTALGTNIFRGFAGTVRGVIDTLGELELSLLRIQKVSGADTKEMASLQSQIDQLVAYTPYQAQELMGLAEALKFGGINLKEWRDETGKAITLGSEYAKGVSQMDDATLQMAKGVKVSALSVLSDFAAIANRGDMPTFMKGIQRLFSTGSGRMLLDQLTQEGRTALLGAPDTQKMQGTAEDAIKRMYEYLQKKQAVGMSAMMSGTATGIISNIKEIPMRIFKAMGGDPTDPKSPFGKLKKAMASLFASIQNVLDSEEWKKGMGQLFNDFVDKAVPVLKLASDAVSKLLELMGKYPKTFGTFVVGASLAVAVLSVLAGTFLTVASSIGSAAVAFLGIGIAFKQLAGTALFGKIVQNFKNLQVVISGSIVLMKRFAASLLLNPTFLLVTAGIAGIVTSLKYLWNLSPSFRKFGRGFVAFFQGLAEAIQNWSGATTEISTETAQKLEQAGMLTPFLELIRGLRHAQLLMKEFWNQTKTAIAGAFGVFLSFSGRTNAEVEKIKKTIVGDESGFKSFFLMLTTGFGGVIHWIAKFGVVLSMLHIGWLTVSGAFQVGIVTIVSYVERLISAFEILNRVLGDEKLSPSKGIAIMKERWAHSDAALQGYIKEKETDVKNATKLGKSFLAAANTPVYGKQPQYQRDLLAYPNLKAPGQEEREKADAEKFDKVAQKIATEFNRAKNNQPVLLESVVYMNVDGKTIAKVVNQQNTKQKDTVPAAFKPNESFKF